MPKAWQQVQMMKPATFQTIKMNKIRKFCKIMYNKTISYINQSYSLRLFSKINQKRKKRYNNDYRGRFRSDEIEQKKKTNKQVKREFRLIGTELFLKMGKKQKKKKKLRENGKAVGFTFSMRLRFVLRLMKTNEMKFILFVYIYDLILHMKQCRRIFVFRFLFYFILFSAAPSIWLLFVYRFDFQYYSWFSSCYYLNFGKVLPKKKTIFNSMNMYECVIHKHISLIWTDSTMRRKYILCLRVSI